MKILVLSTGGTIGSEAHDGIISPDSKTTVKLLSLYRSQNIHDDTEFICEKAADTLSENITDDFYETLINFFLNFSNNGFGGVIVLHGTDTLDYTAALVSMACRNFSLPVGFVSANLPLQDPNSNGVSNFGAAVQYIKAGGNGFFVPYRNHDGEIKIHLATRLFSADSVYDDFNSISDLILADYNNEEIKFSDNALMPSQNELANPQSAVYNDKIELNKKIILIKTYPGIDYSLFDLKDKNIAAVLNLAYHSGTAPAYLSDFAERCRALGIDNYICPVKNTESLYASAAEILKIGVRPLPQMTVASAIANLKIFYHSDNLNHKILNQSLYFEII